MTWTRRLAICAGDAQARIVRAAGGETVRRFRKLQRDARPSLRHPQDMAAMVAPRLFGPGANGDRYPGGPKQRVSPPPDKRIWVLHRRDDAAHASLDDRVRARARRPEMRAGLKGHIERRAARRFAGLIQRDPLGVRPSPGRRGSAPDDRSVLHQDRADRRVGGGETEGSRSEIEGRRHPAQVLLGACGRRCAHVAGASRRCRAGSRVCAESGSASSSPTMALKSRASRKLR